MNIFGKAKSLGSKLIRQYGAKITMQRTEPGAFNPSTGRTSDDKITAWTPSAIRAGISITPMTDTRIKAGDSMLVVDIVGHPTPQTGDIATIGGEKWEIVVAMPVEPADELVLFKGAIRRV